MPAESASQFIALGWQQLLKDNDIQALDYFSRAYEAARSQNDIENAANALLDMGICQFSVSYSRGLEYAFQSMTEFKKLEKEKPLIALQGRGKCLELISTIYSRQGKYRESIDLSSDARKSFPEENDSTGTLGLIYNTLGIAYSKLNRTDSSDYYHQLALRERTITKNYMYLPGSLISAGDIELRKGNKDQSKNLYERAMAISDSTGNRQAMVLSLLAVGSWYDTAEHDLFKAEENFLKAKSIAHELTDKSFYLKTLEKLISLNKSRGDFKMALSYQEEINEIHDTLFSWDKQKELKSLEIKFRISEKERQLLLVQKENEVAKLHNLLLGAVTGFIILISGGVILFLRRINKRDRQLLKANEELVRITEEQKRIKEQTMQNEIEHKESQLSAMTIQMLQKNDLMREVKEKLESNSSDKNPELIKLISKGQINDKEWVDFNRQFENVNKNFYARLKMAYPEISPNDLKICALIKLNLSIKEMANILNISPDSVKTARYRLRKKLQLNTEDNLTDFILQI